MVGSLRRLIASGLALVWAWPIIVFSGAATAQRLLFPPPPLLILRRYLLRRRRERANWKRVFKNWKRSFRPRRGVSPNSRIGYAGWRNYPPVPTLRAAQPARPRRPRPRRPLRRVARWLPLEARSSVVRPLPAVRSSDPPSGRFDMPARQRTSIPSHLRAGLPDPVQGWRISVPVPRSHPGRGPLPGHREARSRSTARS